MAVTTTYQEILNAAYGKSLKNNPGRIATESTELLQLAYRALCGLYAVAARVNPEFFAETASVAFAADGWPRPETAESIFGIETPAGDEVVVVSREDTEAESGKPAVYRFGQKFRSAGNALDPVAGNLTFFYSKRPVKPALLTDTLDPLWVEQFNELLVLETAIYLAQKDGRADEMPGLKEERATWARQYISFLEHETANERRRFGHIRRINTNTLVPIMSLLAGASE